MTPDKVWGFQNEEGKKLKMLDDVCGFLHVTPYVVFVLAYEIAGDKSHDHDMMEHFHFYCKADKFGLLEVKKVPQVVEDFCLRILTGELKLNIKRKKKEGDK